MTEAGVETKVETQICTGPDCDRKGQALPLSEFGPHKQNKGRQPRCRRCKGKANKKIQEGVRAFILDEKKKAGKCTECGKVPARIEDLEFAHFDRECKYRTKNGKTLAIGKFKSVKAVKAELPKGRWLCSECHIKETNAETKLSDTPASEQLRWEASFWQKYVDQEKQRRGKCADCGLEVKDENMRHFHFDHRDPRTKLMAISNMVRQRVPLRVLKREMALCDLRCVDCHRKRTKDEGHYKNRNARAKTTEKKLTPEMAAKKEELWETLAAKLLIAKEGRAKGFRSFAKMKG